MDQSLGVVQRTIRASGRFMLIVSLAAFVMFIGFFVVGTPMLINYIYGPRLISTSELTSITDVRNVRRYWVTTTGAKAIDTGWQQVVENTTYGIPISSNVQDSYAVLVVGDRLLLVDLPGDVQVTASTAVTYTGALTPISSDLATHVISDIRTQAPNVADRLLPFVLDTHDFRSSGLPGIVVILFTLLVALWFLYHGLIRLSEPHSHPIWTQLKRTGDAETAAVSINDELAVPHKRLGSVHITAHWLIDARSLYLKAARLEDVAWMYQKVTRRRVNGIPVGTSYTALILDRYNTVISVSGNQQMVLDSLQAIHEAAPWALVGYDPVKQNTWRKNRAQFLDVVRQRQEQWSASAGFNRGRAF